MLRTLNQQQKPMKTIKKLIFVMQLLINLTYVEFVFNILKFQDSIFNNTIYMLYHRVEISKILGKLLTPFL